MSKRKKPKIVIPEKLLAGKSAEEQANIRQDVADVFKDFVPGSPPPGQVVRPLAHGTTTCPECGEALERYPDDRAVQLPAGIGTAPLTGKLVYFIECPKCDSPFMLEAKS